MMDRSGELWLFAVDSPESDGVYLVGGAESGPSLWQAMQRSDSGRWELRRHLESGEYRFGYFAAFGSTFINCGTERLHTARLDGDDPTVTVSPAMIERVPEPAPADAA